jgi:hypothetical protein
VAEGVRRADVCLSMCSPVTFALLHTCQGTHGKGLSHGEGVCSAVAYATLEGHLLQGEAQG